jgi:hypothetical protein
MKGEKGGFLPCFGHEPGENTRQKNEGIVFKEQSVAGEIVARRTPIHSALCRGTSPHNAVVSSCLRLMREAFGQAALEFCTAPFLRGPNHRSMRGLLLAFSSTHSCTAFSLLLANRGDLRHYAHKAFSRPLPKTCTWDLSGAFRLQYIHPWP